MTWDLVNLEELHPKVDRRWDKLTPNMKEIIRRNDGTWEPYTNLLDPDSKPYLVLTMDGEYVILYWKAWFEGNKWSGSDWYDKPVSHSTQRVLRSKKWPKRVWELNTVDYAPRKIVKHKTDLELLLENYKVKSYKSLPNGLIAIRKGGMWLYFRYNPNNKSYQKTGSTEKLRR